MRHPFLRRPRYYTAIFLALSLCLLALTDLTPRLPAQTRPSSKPSDSIREGEVVVRLRPGASLQAVNSRYDSAVRKRLSSTNQYLLKLNNSRKFEDVMSMLKSDSEVLSSSPNYVIRNAEVSHNSQAYIDHNSQAYIDGESPISFYSQSSMKSLHLYEAQLYSQGAGVQVAVIDTGIDFSHPLFAGRIANPNYDFVDNDNSPQEVAGGSGYGHGTFVAGIVALTAPRARIMPLRAFDADGVGNSFDIAQAICFAADNGAQIINMSFGMFGVDPTIDAALDYAYDRAYMVASAGNDNLETLHYPGLRTSRTLAVTSATDDDHKASFANYHVDTGVAAPGVNVYSAYPGGLWAYWSGTSFSTPLVAGEAALLLEVQPAWNSALLNTAIRSSGINIDSLNPGYVLKLGQVRIDFFDAINYALNY
jgi:subtilisin family serine protease